MTDVNRRTGFIQLPQQAFGQILRDAVSGRAPEEAAEALRSLGIASAASFRALLVERLGTAQLAAVAPERFWTELAEMFRELGFGSMREEEVHPGLISIAATDWFERTGARGGQPCCHFTTGLLAELLRSIVESEVAALEVECGAEGAATCRFLVGSPIALQEVYEGMAGGVSYRDAIAALP